MRLTSSMWLGPGLLQYLLKTLTAYEMSGLVCTASQIKEPIADWYQTTAS